jgi:GNAT superfamily N-acetyltransferase
MEIINSTLQDIDELFRLYDEGTAYQKTRAAKHWQGFDRDMVIQEIAEKRQWKIIVDGEIACVFCIAFNDAALWLEKDKEPSIYLHRIATNPSFRGRGFVKHIADWARQYAREHEKKYIRMDTGSGNEKLNTYYVSCGFTYKGVTGVHDAEDLPAHYRGGTSALFELKV